MGSDSIWFGFTTELKLNSVINEHTLTDVGKSVHFYESSFSIS